MNPQKVCKLKKALYGLKQSSRAWFDKFTRAVKHMRYQQCQFDHCITGRRIVYVDNIILTGDHNKEIQKLKEF